MFISISYCLTKELGPKDTFSNNHILRVDTDRPCLRLYFKDIAKRHSLDINTIQIYLAYEVGIFTPTQQKEIWCPIDNNSYRTAGDPARVLDDNYELKCNDQLVVITGPPKPAILYQFGVLCNNVGSRIFPYHPKRWISVDDMEPIIPRDIHMDYAKSTKTKGTRNGHEQKSWPLVRYHLEVKCGLHKEAQQKKANLVPSYLIGCLWSSWLTWNDNCRRGPMPVIRDDQVLQAGDAIVIIRKPMPKGFLPFKPMDFYSLEVI